MDHYTTKYTVLSYSDLLKLVDDAYMLYLRALKDAIRQELGPNSVSELKIEQEFSKRVLNLMPGRNQEESVRLIANYVMSNMGEDGFITTSRLKSGWPPLYDQLFNVSLDPKSKRDLLQRITRVKVRKRWPLPHSVKAKYRKKDDDNFSSSLAARLGVKSTPISSERRLALKKKPYLWMEPETFLPHILDVWEHYKSDKSDGQEDSNTAKAPSGTMHVHDLITLCRDMVQAILHNAKREFKALRLCPEGSFEFDQKLAAVYSGLLPGYSPDRGSTANEKAIAEQFASLLLNYLDPDRKGYIDRDTFLVVFPIVGLCLVDYNQRFAHAVAPAAGFLLFPLLFPPASTDGKLDSILPTSLIQALNLEDTIVKLSPIEDKTKYLTTLAQLANLRPNLSKLRANGVQDLALLTAQKSEDRALPSSGRKVSRVKELADATALPGATPLIRAGSPSAIVLGSRESHFHYLWAPLDDEESKSAEEDFGQLVRLAKRPGKSPLSFQEAVELERDRQRSVALAQTMALSINMVHSMPPVYGVLNHILITTRAAFGIVDTFQASNVKLNRKSKAHDDYDDDDDDDYDDDDDDDDDDNTGYVGGSGDHKTDQGVPPAQTQSSAQLQPYSSLTDPVTPSATVRVGLTTSANPQPSDASSATQASRYDLGVTPLVTARTVESTLPTIVASPVVSEPAAQPGGPRPSFTSVRASSTENEPALVALAAQAAEARRAMSPHSSTSPTSSVFGSRVTRPTSARTESQPRAEGNGTSSTNAAAMVTTASSEAPASPEKTSMATTTAGADVSTAAAAVGGASADPLASLSYSPAPAGSNEASEIEKIQGLVSELGLGSSQVPSILEANVLARPPFAKLHAALVVLDQLTRARTVSKPLFNLQNGESVMTAMFPENPATALFAKEAKPNRVAAATKWIEYVLEHQNLSAKLKECCEPLLTVTPNKIANNIMSGQHVPLTLRLMQATLLLYAINMNKL